MNQTAFLITLNICINSLLLCVSKYLLYPIYSTFQSNCFYLETSSKIYSFLSLYLHHLNSNLYNLFPRLLMWYPDLFSSDPFFTWHQKYLSKMQIFKRKCKFSSYPAGRNPINLAQSVAWTDFCSSVKLHLLSFPYVPHFSHTDLQKPQFTMLLPFHGFAHNIFSTGMQSVLLCLATS